MTTGRDVVAEAMTWLRTKYGHQGILKGVRADCIGLVGGTGVCLGFPSAIAWLNDPELKGYGETPDHQTLLTGARRYLKPIPMTLATLGDILVFKFIRYPQHFAIISCLNPMQIIHAYRPAGEVCQNGLDGIWRQGKTWRSLIVPPAWRFQEVSN